MTSDTLKKLSNIPSAEGKTEYIAYPKAIKLLSERINATPEELAAWLFWGAEQGGLTAYLNANELSPPPKFYYGYSLFNKHADYIEPLMACWFNAEDIANFQPVERYITGKALIERWKVHQNIKPEAFIRAKIHESRLADLHPINGGTEAGFSGNDLSPALETGLFSISQIEEIEASDIASDEAELLPKTEKLGHLNHDLEMQKRANVIASELEAIKKRAPTKNEVAKKLGIELGVQSETVLRRIRAEWKKKPQPLVKRRK